MIKNNSNDASSRIRAVTTRAARSIQAFIKLHEQIIVKSLRIIISAIIMEAALFALIPIAMFSSWLVCSADQSLCSEGFRIEFMFKFIICGCVALGIMSLRSIANLRWFVSIMAVLISSATVFVLTFIYSVSSLVLHIFGYTYSPLLLGVIPVIILLSTALVLDRVMGKGSSKRGFKFNGTKKEIIALAVLVAFILAVLHFLIFTLIIPSAQDDGIGKYSGAKKEAAQQVVDFVKVNEIDNKVRWAYKVFVEEIYPTPTSACGEASEWNHVYSLDEARYYTVVVRVKPFLSYSQGKTEAHMGCNKYW